MQLVTSYAQAMANARRFQRVRNARDSIAFRNLGKYYHWFYFDELGAFAPSKFIGYINTSVKNYVSAGTGTDTTRALRRFFVQSPRSSQQFERLAEKLQEWLESLGVSLSNKVLQGSGGIYVRSEVGSKPDPAATDQEMAAQGKEFWEGRRQEVLQNKYERDWQARKECIEKLGPVCRACFLNFEDRYGAIGRGFIHVHHIEPLATLGGNCRINPTVDLVPLCPNCHAMIHRMEPPQTVDALRELIKGQEKVGRKKSR